MEARTLIIDLIATHRTEIAQWRALIEPDADCSEVEDYIARLQRDVARMRGVLGSL
jgi:hypothetical protein